MDERDNLDSQEQKGLSEQAHRSAEGRAAPQIGEASGAIGGVLALIAARLRTSLWLLVTVGIIAAVLVAFGMPAWQAAVLLLAFVAIIAFVPWGNVDESAQSALSQEIAATERSSAMELMAEALPD